MTLAAAVGTALGGLLAPPICWSCSGLARRGDPLCGTCRSSLHRLAPEPVLLGGPSLGGMPVWAPLAYSGPARDLVRALKFRGALALADAMAAQIVANAPPGLLDAAPAAAGCTLVPVPLHPRRLRKRGYNQAAAIAEAIGGRAGLPVLDCLTRSGPSVTQMGRNRAERTAGPAGRIEIRVSAETLVPPGAAASAETPAAAASAETPAAAALVVLVDDVVTTGATLGACRDALVAQGAREVAAVCFARTIGR